MSLSPVCVWGGGGHVCIYFVKFIKVHLVKGVESMGSLG